MMKILALTLHLLARITFTLISSPAFIGSFRKVSFHGFNLVNETLSHLHSGVRRVSYSKNRLFHVEVQRFSQNQGKLALFNKPLYKFFFSCVGMKARQATKIGILALVWVNLSSLKGISFKRRFLGCVRNVFYVRQLNILVIIFWFSFNALYLGENNVNLSETKKCFLCQHVSQPFLKMRKFLLDMRKDFLIISNFYLIEILNEPNSLTVVTSKNILKMSTYVLVLSIFFFS